MPFTPTITPTAYAYRSSPILPGSERQSVDRELRTIGEKLNEVVRAVQELQEYVKTLP